MTALITITKNHSSLDISGRSKGTVFFSLNSVTLLRCKKMHFMATLLSDLFSYFDCKFVNYFVCGKC